MTRSTRKRVQVRRVTTRAAGYVIVTGLGEAPYSYPQKKKGQSK